MIHTRVSRGVLVIELARPEKKNALTGAMYDALTETLGRANDDPDIRVVLIHGSGGAFCAGNDIGDFLDDPPGGPEAPAFRFLRALAGLDKPLVAAVQGVAVGVGATLLLHCDLVYADDSARLAFPFVALGLVPEAGSTLLLPQRVGHARAFELLVGGEAVSAAAAERLGLINAVLPAAELVERAMRQAERIAALPAVAVFETRRLLRGRHDGGAPHALLERIAAEGRIFVDLLGQEAAQAALNAFAGRPPR